MSDTNSTIIRRKAINPLGVLGSFYNAIYENFVDISPISFDNRQLDHCDLRHHYSSLVVDQSKNGYDCLRKLNVDEFILQSILTDLTEPLGITAVVNNRQIFSSNKRKILFYYSYRDHEKTYSMKNVQRANLKGNLSPNSTHMVTKIIYGFEILILIPIDDEHDDRSTIYLLQRIVECLKRNVNVLYLADQEKNILEKYHLIYVYGSDRSIISENSTLLKTLTDIPRWQQDRIFHHPIIFEMHPLSVIFPHELCTSFHENYVTSFSNPFLSIESTLSDVQLTLETIARLFNNQQSSFTRSILEKRSSALSKFYNEYREKLRHLVKVLRQHESLSIFQYSHKFGDHERWSYIAKLIHRLLQDNIYYCDATDFNLDRHGDVDSNLKTIQRRIKQFFSEMNMSVVTWYSNLTLTVRFPDKWEAYYQRFLEKRKNNQLIYIDLSSTRCTLKKFIIKDLSKEKPRRMMNILFLGETGVGKSTFINAFVNYLAYETFDEAEKQKIIAAIPASFITTVGFHFVEVKINIGDPDPNENFNEQGASVTQHCRSYIIRLRSDLHLRLIDTPGMGDTRGIEQDMKNIDHILSYVDQFSHLDAICFLLKPDVSRLNIFFRSCLKQLFTYLTPQAYENIAFCFTNTRSTFYAPGNTGPILRKLLSENEWNGIAFGKQNTFCFDSESFRYLAACRQGVPFESSEREDFMRSWNKSLAESGRLLEFIEDRKAYPLQEWRSPKRLSLELRLLAWPLMEQLRLMIYNIILAENNFVNHQMIMSVSPVEKLFCSKCATRMIDTISPFYIVHYEPGDNNIEKDCQCPGSENQCLIECLTKFSSITKRIPKTYEEQKELLKSYVRELDHLHGWNFLHPILNDFIRDEKEILRRYNHEQHLNDLVLNMLRQLPVPEEPTSEGEISSEVIDELKSIPGIKDHLECIKKCRERRLKFYERFISIRTIKPKHLQKTELYCWL